MSPEPDIGLHCRVCDRWLSKSAFYRDVINASGFKRECKACQTDRQRRQYRTDENGYRQYHLAKAAKRRAEGLA